MDSHLTQSASIGPSDGTSANAAASPPPAASPATAPPATATATGTAPTQGSTWPNRISPVHQCTGDGSDSSLSLNEVVRSGGLVRPPRPVASSNTGSMSSSERAHRSRTPSAASSSLRRKRASSVRGKAPGAAHIPSPFSPPPPHIPSISGQGARQQSPIHFPRRRSSMDSSRDLAALGLNTSDLPAPPPLPSLSTATTSPSAAASNSTLSLLRAATPGSTTEIEDPYDVIVQAADPRHPEHGTWKEKWAGSLPRRPKSTEPGAAPQGKRVAASNGSGPDRLVGSTGHASSSGSHARRRTGTGAIGERDHGASTTSSHSRSTGSGTRSALPDWSAQSPSTRPKDKNRAKGKSKGKGKEKELTLPPPRPPPRVTSSTTWQPAHGQLPMPVANATASGPSVGHARQPSTPSTPSFFSNSASASTSGHGYLSPPSSAYVSAGSTFVHSNSSTGSHTHSHSLSAPASTSHYYSRGGSCSQHSHSQSDDVGAKLSKIQRVLGIAAPAVAPSPSAPGSTVSHAPEERPLPVSPPRIHTRTSSMMSPSPPDIANRRPVSLSHAASSSSIGHVSTSRSFQGTLPHDSPSQARPRPLRQEPAGSAIGTTPTVHSRASSVSSYTGRRSLDSSVSLRRKPVPAFHDPVPALALAVEPSLSAAHKTPAPTLAAPPLSRSTMAGARPLSKISDTRESWLSTSSPDPAASKSELARNDETEEGDEFYDAISDEDEEGDEGDRKEELSSHGAQSGKRLSKSGSRASGLSKSGASEGSGSMRGRRVARGGRGAHVAGGASSSAERGSGRENGALRHASSSRSYAGEGATFLSAALTPRLAPPGASLEQSISAASSRPSSDDGGLDEIEDDTPLGRIAASYRLRREREMVAQARALRERDRREAAVQRALADAPVPRLTVDERRKRLEQNTYYLPPAHPKPASELTGSLGSASSRSLVTSFKGSGRVTPSGASNQRSPEMAHGSASSSQQHTPQQRQGEATILPSTGSSRSLVNGKLAGLFNRVTSIGNSSKGSKSPATPSSGSAQTPSSGTNPALAMPGRGDEPASPRVGLANGSARSNAEYQSPEAASKAANGQPAVAWPASDAVGLGIDGVSTAAEHGQAQAQKRRVRVPSFASHIFNSSPKQSPPPAMNPVSVQSSPSPPAPDADEKWRRNLLSEAVGLSLVARSNDTSPSPTPSSTLRGKPAGFANGNGNGYALGSDHRASPVSPPVPVEKGKENKRSRSQRRKESAVAKKREQQAAFEREIQSLNAAMQSSTALHQQAGSGPGPASANAMSSLGGGGLDGEPDRERGPRQSTSSARGFMVDARGFAVDQHQEENLEVGETIRKTLSPRLMSEALNEADEDSFVGSADGYSYGYEYGDGYGDGERESESGRDGMFGEKRISPPTRSKIGRAFTSIDEGEELAFEALQKPELRIAGIDEVSNERTGSLALGPAFGESDPDPRSPDVQVRIVPSSVDGGSDKEGERVFRSSMRNASVAPVPTEDGALSTASRPSSPAPASPRAPGFSSNPPSSPANNRSGSFAETRARRSLSGSISRGTPPPALRINSPVTPPPKGRDRKASDAGSVVLSKPDASPGSGRSPGISHTDILFLDPNEPNKGLTALAVDRTKPIENSPGGTQTRASFSVDRSGSGSGFGLGLGLGMSPRQGNGSPSAGVGGSGGGSSSGNRRSPGLFKAIRNFTGSRFSAAGLTSPKSSAGGAVNPASRLDLDQLGQPGRDGADSLMAAQEATRMLQIQTENMLTPSPLTPAFTSGPAGSGSNGHRTPRQGQATDDQTKDWSSSFRGNSSPNSSNVGLGFGQISSAPSPIGIRTAPSTPVVPFPAASGAVYPGRTRTMSTDAAISGPDASSAAYGRSAGASASASSAALNGSATTTPKTPVPGASPDVAAFDDMLGRFGLADKELLRGIAARATRRNEGEQGQKDVAADASASASGPTLLPALPASPPQEQQPHSSQAAPATAV